MITDVHHVGIAVRDMAAALRFYSEALGLPVVKEGDAPARGARVTLIAVGGSYLELIQPVTDGSPFARHIEERGEGLHHVALRTDDVDALVASLREWDVPLEGKRPREGQTGGRGHQGRRGPDPSPGWPSSAWGSTRWRRSWRRRATRLASRTRRCKAA